jgi:hypothetical protein
MLGFSKARKMSLIAALRRLRKEKRLKGERLTFQDVESMIWDLPPSRFERVIQYINESLTKFQGKS